MQRPRNPSGLSSPFLRQDARQSDVALCFAWSESSTHQTDLS